MYASVPSCNTHRLAKGSHGLTVVVRHNALEQRDGSLDLLRCEETDDADLGQSAIVELLHQTGGLGLLGLVLVEAEGIVETSDWDRVWDQLLGLVKAGELPGLATTHVVGTSCLGKPLEEANEEDDLPLGSVGESIPLLRWTTSGSTDADPSHYLDQLLRHRRSLGSASP